MLAVDASGGGSTLADAASLLVTPPADVRAAVTVIRFMMPGKVGPGLRDVAVVHVAGQERDRPRSAAALADAQEPPRGLDGLRLRACMAVRMCLQLRWRRMMNGG